MKSKLPVKKKYSICGTWRCTSTQLKRRHWREQDATQLASSGSIPTKEAPKPHVTVRVWCVRRCAIKGRTDLLGNTSAGNSARPTRCCVSGRRFSSEGPFLDLHRRCDSSPLLHRSGPRRLRPITRQRPQGKAARCVWETVKDDVRIFGRSPTMERALRSSFGN